MTQINNDSESLQRRLYIMGSMISMGEKISWGSDTAIMREAESMLAAKDKEIAALRVLHQTEPTVCLSTVKRIATQLGWSPDQVPPGYKLMPINPTQEMLNAGGHVSSEWFNDSAPIGEVRYVLSMKSVYEAMLAVSPEQLV